MHYILLKGSDDQSRIAVNQELKRLRKRVKELEEEIEELKTQQNKTAIQELRMLKEDVWLASSDISGLIDHAEVAKIIEKRIKQLKGENNE